MVALNQDHGGYGTISDQDDHVGSDSQVAFVDLGQGNIDSHATDDGANLPCLQGLEQEPSGWHGKVIHDDTDSDYLTEEERKSRAKKASEYIHEMYKAGIPFFTKRAIQDVVDQIDRIDRLLEETERTVDMTKERFTVQGLDGKEVAFRVQVGEAHGSKYGDWELVHMDPILVYSSYQHLTGDHAWLWDSKLEFCPLRIMYQRHLRHMKSNISVPLDDLQRSIRQKRGPPTEATVRQEFKACLAEWEKSNELRLRLASALDKVKLHSVNKIVAFACATISNNESPHTRLQHVLILALKEILESRQQQPQQSQDNNLDEATPAVPELAGSTTSSSFRLPFSPIRCFAQDPAYTAIDKSILAEHEVTVLDDPRGFLEVDDQSVVISFGPNICVRQIVTDIARPALLVWDTVLNEEDSMRQGSTCSIWGPKKFSTPHELEGHLTDPESPRLRDMIRNEYTELTKLDEIFGDSNMSIYVKKF